MILSPEHLINHLGELGKLSEPEPYPKATEPESLGMESCHWYVAEELQIVLKYSWSSEMSWVLQASAVCCLFFICMETSLEKWKNQGKDIFQTTLFSKMLVIVHFD